jgi:TrmH family RNA methyltransferase
VILDNVRDPQNLGAIIRTAAAFGTAVIASKNSADLYSPKTLRACASSLFYTPVAKDADVIEDITRLKSRGFSVFGASLSEGSRYIQSCDFSGKTALIIGNESRGLAPETEKLCDTLLKIPMAAGVDSLNAAVSAGILVYEVYRQSMR